ncbi:hypothetical protein [Prochlorococcus marinus]|uniref:hypothetical protein n=1 Tax=Prochlorococcus marinus TaxID=1219 RepID=UPI001C58E22A|nr:hypothetical protein [Prochlorococcus marinus]MBW3042179.1 hypothetical protein [Prochlorococcus marinus str. XMU1408]
MTATSTASSVKDKELVPSGFGELSSVNSISHYAESNFNESKVITEKEDFANIFICHIIFYAFFCVSLFFHILLDLGLGSYIKKTYFNLIGLDKKNIIENIPAFA